MEARRQIATLDAMEVTALKPGDVFYLDLRYQGLHHNPFLIIKEKVNEKSMLYKTLPFLANTRWSTPNN